MKKKIAIIGCGYLGNIIGNAMKKGLLSDYEFCAAMSRKKEDAEDFCSSFGGKAVENLEELLKEKPNYVIETASVEMARNACIPCLTSGANFIPLSIGAFSDADFYELSIKTAEEHKVKLYIPHGAVGGFDVLSTAALMANAEGKVLTAGISTRKGPKSLYNTPVYQDKMEEKEMTAFEGTCEEAIALLPTKVNVAVAQSLVTIGPKKATAKITSVPDYIGDEHTITAEMEGIKVVSQVYSETSAIAAWSIVSLLRNLSSPVNFF